MNGPYREPGIVETDAQRRERYQAELQYHWMRNGATMSFEEKQRSRERCSELVRLIAALGVATS